MRPIQAALKRRIAADPFMKECCYTGIRQNVSWEHCWIYKGCQINEAWAIVPLNRYLNTSSMPKSIKDFCKWVSINRATDEDFAKYPKFDWPRERERLNKIYGDPRKTKEEV